MLLLVLPLLLVVWSLPVSAAETFKVPITIVPGSITFQGHGDYTPTGDPTPATLPISQQMVGNTSSGACSEALVTVEAELVDGGFEAEISGTAAGTNCSIGGRIVFEIEVLVPELGGTTTVVRLIPEVLESNFSDYWNVGAIFDPDFPTSSSIPAFRTDGTGYSELRWNGATAPQLEPEAPDPIYAKDWIPGDTMRFRTVVLIYMTGNTGNTAQGNVKVRWEYRVTVPEPSASLSLPLGMAWLAGLSMMRGGV